MSAQKPVPKEVTCDGLKGTAGQALHSLAAKRPFPIPADGFGVEYAAGLKQSDRKAFVLEFCEKLGLGESKKAKALANALLEVENGYVFRVASHVAIALLKEESLDAAHFGAMEVINSPKPLAGLFEEIGHCEETAPKIAFYAALVYAKTRNPGALEAFASTIKGTYTGSTKNIHDGEVLLAASKIAGVAMYPDKKQSGAGVIAVCKLVDSVGRSEKKALLAGLAKMLAKRTENEGAVEKIANLALSVNDPLLKIEMLEHAILIYNSVERREGNEKALEVLNAYVGMMHANGVGEPEKYFIGIKAVRAVQDGKVAEFCNSVMGAPGPGAKCRVAASFPSS